MRVWIDNDGCPRMAKELVTAAAARRNIPVSIVGNSVHAPLHSSASQVEHIRVPSGFDAADHYIADHVQPGDLVISSDVPLGARVIAAGATMLNSHGVVFDKQSIGDQLATRNLSMEMREAGAFKGGGQPLGPKEKKKFADALDRLLTKLTLR